MEGIKLKRKRAPGAGRPVGTGNFGEPTKVVRLPQSVADNVQAFVEKQQELERIINQWKDELEPRKTSERVKLAYEVISELVFILEG